MIQFVLEHLETGDTPN